MDNGGIIVYPEDKIALSVEGNLSFYEKIRLISVRGWLDDFAYPPNLREP